MNADTLTLEILKKAKQGAYKNQLLEDLKYSGYQLYGKTVYPSSLEIVEAIRKAKRTGMYSVRGMGTRLLGTYYQYDGDV